MEASLAQVPSRGRRVLLVEDDVELREALADALSDSGHDVTAISDGRAALHHMRSTTPEVVVLDLMMPVMDGWQFRVEQRRDPALSETPVIAISASHSAAASAIDADVYLQKPLETTTLLRAIDEVTVSRERRLSAVQLAQTERLTALGTLAAGVAHEINNPLTYVLLHLTRARRTLSDLTTQQNGSLVETIESHLQGALEGVERIRAITSGIRTFSRSDGSHQSPIDVRAALEAALRMVMSELRHRARLVRSLDDVPPVFGNEGRLGQVFLNLLTNAVQALPQGDGLDHEIRVVTRTDPAGRAVVEIADTGVGIPEHLQRRIFEPFFSTKPIGQGTGLGLSISRGVVVAMGGEISVTSAPGEGTTFRVVLPAMTSDTHLRRGLVGGPPRVRARPLCALLPSISQEGFP